MSGRIDFSLDFNMRGAGAKRNKDCHYRIYILGNFSRRTDIPWAQRKIIPINIDNFDQVMTQIMPTLELSAGRTLSFDTLEDFHPDVWLQKVPILADLLDLKRQLSNPNTAEQASAKIKSFLPVEAQDQSPAPLPEGGESQEQMLERLLGKKPEASVSEPDTVERLLQQIVSPYVGKDAAPEHQALIDIIDRTVSQYLRALLHRPDFQSLESLWMAVAGLVNEECADEHSIFLLDIGRDELLSELSSAGQAFEQKLLAHMEFGDSEQEVLLVADYRFSDSVDDYVLLGLCSRLAKVCKGFFIAAPDRLLIENSIFAQASDRRKWDECRKQICADHVILAYPRYLLRLPYGDKRSPLEALAFDELSGVPQSDELLWGSPAFLCARVLIRVGGQQMTEDPLFFNDVSVFTFDLDGEQILQPGAEAIMSEKQVSALLSEGIMPLVGFYQRQGVRLIALSPLSCSA